MEARIGREAGVKLADICTEAFMSDGACCCTGGGHSGACTTEALVLAPLPAAGGSVADVQVDAVEPAAAISRWPI